MSEYETLSSESDPNYPAVLEPIIFESFPKLPRLFKDATATEKIDGTNAAIIVTEDGRIAAQSRNKLITPGKTTDNYGFAGWVDRNKDILIEALGPGRHFGEWWGSGIQRGYGLTEKRFSLFNTIRWCAHDAEPQPIPSGDPRVEKMQERLPACVSLVPVLYRGLFGPKHDENFIAKLRAEGSMAAPGFMKPEGIVIFHVAANVGFKKTIEKDEQPKSKALATA